MFETNQNISERIQEIDRIVIYDSWRFFAGLFILWNDFEFRGIYIVI